MSPMTWVGSEGELTAEGLEALDLLLTRPSLRVAYKTVSSNSS